MVSKSDMQAIILYVTGLHDWIRAAHACLESRKEASFYGAVNEFIARRGR